MVNKCFKCLQNIPDNEFTCGRKACRQAMYDFENYNKTRTVDEVVDELATALVNVGNSPIEEPSLSAVGETTAENAPSILAKEGGDK